MDNLKSHQEIEKCATDEKKLARLPLASLKSIVKQHHRVVDLRESGKWDCIGMILRARFGVKILKQCEGWS